MNQSTPVKLPDSHIVEVLTDFLNSVEKASSEATITMNKLMDEDGQLGYAKAAGHALSQLECLAVSAKAYRNVYLTSTNS
jgi:hypothetical protein